MKQLNKVLLVILLVILAAVSFGCESKADVASTNLSKAADNFEITRRIHFYNGITGEDFMVIEGLCSLGNNDAVGSLSVTCKTGPGVEDYRKFFLGLSDNVTYWTEDINPSTVNVYNYRVIMRPTTIIPGLEVDIP